MRAAILAFFLAAAVASASAAGPPAPSHAAMFEHYEGTKTCLACHQQEAESFFHSQHYQWEGEAPDIVNAHGRRLGKMNTVNDFCTNPKANWIGLVYNSRGEVISKGCSACHAGFGKLPSPKMDQAQLENIDCLMCHASGYQRDLYKNDDGSLQWKPILWKNPVGLDSVSKRISLPKRVMCLRCHASSGGGANYKRGDLEYKLADADRNFDVHMGTDGKNMQCIACHAGDDHRVRGRGTDLSGTDMPSRPLSCDTQECHGSAPHKVAVLNLHAQRVNCTVCHIPDFAKEDPTDMSRDWSKAVFNAEADNYTADIKLEKNVRPVYAWYNGTTWEQLMGEPVKRLPDGSVGMMVPQGSRSDPRAKIFAFKLHRGKMPLWTAKQWIIPIVVEEVFPTGQIDPAVKLAAKDIYGVDNVDYSWTDTSRYMGIFHEVQPASQALQCLDCHRPGGRMDWKALGYDGDPLDRMIKMHASK